jgi:hypothetical protein
VLAELTMTVLRRGEGEVLGREDPIVEGPRRSTRGYDCMSRRNSTYVSKEAPIEGAKASGQELHDHRGIGRRFDDPRDDELVSVSRDRNPITRHDVVKEPHAKRIACCQDTTTPLVPDDEGVIAAQTGKKIVPPLRIGGDHHLPNPGGLVQAQRPSKLVEAIEPPVDQRDDPPLRMQMGTTSPASAFGEDPSACGTAS